jgi:hypothetical protein
MGQRVVGKILFGNKIGKILRLSAATAVAFGVVVAPALAQQALICFTLHNDLANFDRRAHRPLPAREVATPWADWAHTCPNLLGGFPFYECSPPPNLVVPESPEAFEMHRAWSLSSLGGRDPIRLRILDEMVRNGCPLPTDADLLAVPEPPRVAQAAPPPRRRPKGPVLHVLGAKDKPPGVSTDRPDGAGAPDVPHLASSSSVTRAKTP